MVQIFSGRVNMLPRVFDRVFCDLCFPQLDAIAILLKLDGIASNIDQRLYHLTCPLTCPRDLHNAETQTARSMGGASSSLVKVAQSSVTRSARTGDGLDVAYEPTSAAISGCCWKYRQRAPATCELCLRPTDSPLTVLLTLWYNTK